MNHWPDPKTFLQQLSFAGYTPMTLPQQGEAESWEWEQTVLPPGCEHLRDRLAPLQTIPKLSTFAIAALIQLMVHHMPPEQCFLNIGTWYGFTLLAGMLGNPDKICIGVDDFSNLISSEQRLILQRHSPEQAFRRWFEQFRSPRHAFYGLEFRQYFRLTHGAQPIGLYFYDADHAYAAQYQALELAHPWLAAGAWILVDDTNHPEPAAATRDFLARYATEYQLVFDQKTCCNGHPSFWNGLMVLQKQGQSSEPPADPLADLLRQLAAGS